MTCAALKQSPEDEQIVTLNQLSFLEFSSYGAKTSSLLYDKNLLLLIESCGTHQEIPEVKGHEHAQDEDQQGRYKDESSR